MNQNILFCRHVNSSSTFSAEMERLTHLWDNEEGSGTQGFALMRLPDATWCLHFGKEAEDDSLHSDVIINNSLLSTEVLKVSSYFRNSPDKYLQRVEKALDDKLFPVITLTIFRNSLVVINFDC